MLSITSSKSATKVGPSATGEENFSAMYFNRIFESQVNSSGFTWLQILNLLRPVPFPGSSIFSCKKINLYYIFVAAHLDYSVKDKWLFSRAIPIFK